MLTNLGYLYNVTTTSINKLIHELKINFHRFSTREWIKCILKKMRESTLSDPFEILRTIVDAYQTMALSSIKISTVLQFFSAFLILNTEVGYILNIYIYIYKNEFPLKFISFQMQHRYYLQQHDFECAWWNFLNGSQAKWLLMKGPCRKKVGVAWQRGVAYQKKAWSISDRLIWWKLTSSY